jgi:hypothetical protein
MQDVENERWGYRPLVAFAIFSVTPSVLLLLSWLLFWSDQLEAGQALRGVSPFSAAVANWPFLALYFFKGTTKVQLSRCAMPCNLHWS